MRNVLFGLMALVIVACGPQKKEPNINEGTINVGIDESIRYVLDAEMDAYSNIYKGASFNRFTIPENQAVKLLLEDSMDVICITRTLNEEELKILSERKFTYKPAPMALDAVVLISNQNGGEESISTERLKQLFVDDTESTKLVFDVGNSSNLNIILSKLGIKEFNRKNVVAAGSNEKVFDWVKKDKNAIGFVGFNLISEKSNSSSQELKRSVNILSVKDSLNYVFPEKRTILEQTYPFNRIIYLHTLGTSWGVENGFIRYACTKPGQLIAEKMGLVPYYAIPKQFVLSKEPID
jgi:phosphate transport system substrate-binding protein